MMIKAALIDLDDTIINSHHLYIDAEKSAYALFNSKYPEKVSWDEFHGIYKQIKKQNYSQFPNSPTAKNRLIRFARLTELVLGQIDSELAVEMQRNFFEYCEKNVTLASGAKDLLVKLRNKKIKIALVSDGTIDFRLLKINACGLNGYFDYLVTSDDVDATKPSPLPFLAALNKCSASSAEAVFIGNSESTDILGAQLIGLKTICAHTNPNMDFDDRKDVEAEYTVRSLDRVIDIIEYLNSN